MKIYLLLILLSSTLTFVLVSTLFFGNSNNLNVGDKILFKSEDDKFEFIAIPSKGRDYKMMEKLFSEYKLKLGTGTE